MKVVPSFTENFNMLAYLALEFDALILVPTVSFQSIHGPNIHGPNIHDPNTHDLKTNIHSGDQVASDEAVCETRFIVIFRI